MSDPYAELGARERQIMDVLFRLGKATAQEVLDGLGDPPSYSAVRGMLRLLKDKGYVRHEWDGPRYVYLPTVDRDLLLADMSDAATPNEIATAVSDAREWLTAHPGDTQVIAALERLFEDERQLLA